jgi:hypothetical protein
MSVIAPVFDTNGPDFLDYSSLCSSFSIRTTRVDFLMIFALPDRSPLGIVTDLALRGSLGVASGMPSWGGTGNSMILITGRSCEMPSASRLPGESWDRLPGVTLSGLPPLRLGWLTS